MSEYQYYEFRAVDNPLDKKAMAKIALTSRAEITPTSLINEYHWGDFRGNPDKLMAEYFDAFLYFANWGTHRLMFRLPRGCLDAKTIKPYCATDCVRLVKGNDQTIVDFSSGEDCRDDEWRDWRLGDLLPLRTDLMAGDRRCLYLGWLAAVQNGEVEDDELEPPVPPGLMKLSGTLRDFAEFLYLNSEIVEVAAKSSGLAPATPSAEDTAAWIASLPETDKNGWLLRTMHGEQQRVTAELLARFHASRKQPMNASAEQGRRTAGQLREAYETLCERHEQEHVARETRNRERQEREQTAARAAQLDALAGKEDQLWRQVDELVKTKQAGKYAEAVAKIKDLHDLSQRSNSVHFTTMLRDLLLIHSAKPAFKRRIQEAGLAP